MAQVQMNWNKILRARQVGMLLHDVRQAIRQVAVPDYGNCCLQNFCKCFTFKLFGYSSLYRRDQ